MSLLTSAATNYQTGAQRSPKSSSDFDVAIVGSGFGGSLLAMIARQRGRSVILLERGQHPRFAIGESSTPLANLLLEELARRYELPAVAPLTKWGAWQAKHPEIGCGLKRGFTFYHHRAGERWAPHPARENELMVAASPHDRIADTHWYRPDFDHFLVRQAQTLGAEFQDKVALTEAAFDESGVTLRGAREGQPLRVRARFLIDATGPRGFLHHALRLEELPFPHLPATQALYAHFTGVARWATLHPFEEPKRAAGILPAGETETHPSAQAHVSGCVPSNDGTEFLSLLTPPAPRQQKPPYPPDDAALHHVFDGGWVWVLRFNNGVTSAGLAATPRLAGELQVSGGEPAWHRLLERFPSLGEQFRSAKAVTPFVYSPRLPFRSARVVGERWALLPSAAGVIDPLLSTGLPLTLLGLTRLAKLLEDDWESPRLRDGLLAYERQTIKELLTAESLVATLYACLNDFPKFSAGSLLYFAAASFAETARRLGHSERAGESFLAADHPAFGPRLRACLEEARRGAGLPLPALVAQIHAAISPIDVAGLSDASRRNWFPACAKDALAAAGKLGVSQSEVADLLRRAGW